MCECDSMLHDNWLDIPCIVILHPFCFKPGMVSYKNIRRNIFIIIFLFSFHKGITAKCESSCCLPKVLVLWQKLILGKPSNYSNWWSGFPSNTNLWVPISSFLSTRFAIFMINICIYNHPFLWTGSMRRLKICVWQSWRELIQEISHVGMDLMKCSWNNFHAYRCHLPF